MTTTCISLKNLTSLIVVVSTLAEVSVGAESHVFVNSLGMKLKLIPAGEFLMGSPTSDSEAHHDELPQHRVRISRSLFLGAFEVTRGQFAAYVGATGARTEAETNGKGGWGADANGKFVQALRFTWRNPGYAQADDHPVVVVSWNDVVAFCQWLSQREGRAYRLPTEAEWEFACRAGTLTKFEYGADAEELAMAGNVADQLLEDRFPDRPAINARDGYVFTAPVGQFRPNAFGLYDMHGNVGEWCQDIYDPKAYADRSGTTVDPLVLMGSPDRVGRGGCWYYTARYCRSARRNRDAQADGAPHRGFRVALTAPST
ncbi:MAG: formylglycine-generating enzyme family protein [Verrucomicrobia bacterium]|nr:formylglycine-generating enzyme family protein [Verrucomicrobiota bacterium]